MRRIVMLLLGIVILIATATSFAIDCGDVNNDGFINILDIVHLINYKYKAGPEPNCGTVTDINGNVYKTVTIGTQVWMAENLKVANYGNGDPIPYVTNNTEWAGLATGAYCEYNNDVSNVATYGLLYNWFAIVDTRELAPMGWHVPTDAEWKQLEMYLGMSQYEADATGWRGHDEGCKLKEPGIMHWFNPNHATNESDFSALPGGYRDINGTYGDVRSGALFWTFTWYSSDYAWKRYLRHDDSSVSRHYSYGQCGFSVRCVKN